MPAELLADVQAQPCATTVATLRCGMLHLEHPRLFFRRHAFARVRHVNPNPSVGRPLQTHFDRARSCELAGIQEQIHDDPLQLPAV